MRSILIILFFMLVIVSAKSYAQKWQPGRFTDVKGNIEGGFINVNPSGKGPIKNEGFIEFKEDNKAEPYKLSASDLRSFVVGKDSFVVAHPPGNENWAKNEFDFVKVALDDDIIPASAPNEPDAEAGILPDDDEIVPLPKESAVFTKPVFNTKITGLESLDSGEAQLVDVSKRTGRRLGAAPSRWRAPSGR